MINQQNQIQAIESNLEVNGLEQHEDDDSRAMITYKNTEYLRDLIVTPLQRVQSMDEEIRQFKIIIPKVVAQTP